VRPTCRRRVLLLADFDTCHSKPTDRSPISISSEAPAALASEMISACFWTSPPACSTLQVRRGRGYGRAYEPRAIGERESESERERGRRIYINKQRF
jgi:hypothetical protein